MLKVETIEVMGIRGALKGMRNPMNSWNKSDSHDSVIGPGDMKLCKALIKAGSSDRKFLRMIHVQADVVAPLYWWKEFDTYKVGTVANSTSTMHKLASTPITMDCFEMDDYSDVRINEDEYKMVKHLQSIKGFKFSEEIIVDN